MALAKMTQKVAIALSNSETTNSIIFGQPHRGNKREAGSKTKAASSKHAPFDQVSGGTPATYMTNSERLKGMHEEEEKKKGNAIKAAWKKISRQAAKKGREILATKRKSERERKKALREASKASPRKRPRSSAAACSRKKAAKVGK